MAYNTIPVEEPSSADALLAKPKTNLKRLAGGAAVASFVQHERAVKFDFHTGPTAASR